MICIYVAIGRRASTVASVVQTLKTYGALPYSIVVAATANDPQYAAPYAGASMAEYFVHQGKDVPSYTMTFQACGGLPGHFPADRADPRTKPIPAMCFICIPACWAFQLLEEKELGSGSITNAHH